MSKLTFKTEKIVDVMSKVSYCVDKALICEIKGSKKNAENVGYVIFSAYDGTAQVTVRTVAKIDSNEDSVVYFGKELASFVSRLAGFGEECVIETGVGSATLKCGSACLEVPIKSADSIVAPTFSVSKDDMVGRVALSNDEFKKALAKGGYAALTSKDNSYVEAVHFLVIKEGENNILRVESMGFANGTVASAPVLGLELASGREFLPSFAISCRKLAAILALAGDDMIVTLCKGAVVFSTKAESVTAPFYGKVNINADALVVPASDKYLFGNDENDISFVVDKKAFIGAVQTIEVVASTLEESKRGVAFTAEAETLKVSTSDGKSVVDVKISKLTGDLETVKFNPINVIKVASNVGDGSFVFSVSERPTKTGKAKLLKIRYGTETADGGFIAPINN